MICYVGRNVYVIWHREMNLKEETISFEGIHEQEPISFDDIHMDIENRSDKASLNIDGPYMSIRFAEPLECGLNYGGPRRGSIEVECRPELGR